MSVYPLHTLAVDESGESLFHSKTIDSASNLEVVLCMIGKINPAKEQQLVYTINRYVELKKSGAVVDPEIPSVLIRAVKALLELISLDVDDQRLEIGKS